MADELIENAEFGKKRKDEEDPILVAQRYLNIYRQMHIFNKERQNQFDDMLLELPLDIRILLSTLPGGSLLLEHIEELEQKRGLVSTPIKKDNTFRKKANKDAVETASSGSKSSVGSVVIDSSFATELSSSLALALQQTEKRYKDDIKTLTETITQSIMSSQTAIANMMKDIVIESRNKNLSNNDNSSFKSVPKENIVEGASPSPTANTTAKTPQEQPTPSVLPSPSKPSKETGKKEKKEKSEEAVETVATEQTLNETLLAEQKEERPDEKAAVSKKKNKNSKKDEAAEIKKESIFFQSTRSSDSILAGFQEKQPANKKDEETFQAVSVAAKDDIFAEKTSENESMPTDNTAFSESEISISEPDLEIPIEKNSDNQEKKSLNFGKISALANDLAKKIGKNRHNKELSEKFTSENIISTADTSANLETSSPNEKNEADTLSSFVENLSKNILPTETSAGIEQEPLPEKNTDVSDNVSTDETGLGIDFNAIFNSGGEENYDTRNNNDTSGTNTDNELYTEELNQIRKALQATEPETGSEPDKSAKKEKEIKKEESVDVAIENTAFNIPDLSHEMISLDDLPDMPVSLDDISEEPISLNDFEDDLDIQTSSAKSDFTDDSYTNPSEEQDWEWEYVDDNGNTDDDWEWEYVDDNGNTDDDWEWEYVEDDRDYDETNNK